MAIKGQSRIILIILFSLVLHLSTSSQNRKYLVISGKIITESESNNNGAIQIIKNNGKNISTQIPENGRFRLELEYDTEYKLIFSRSGHLYKTIIVNTEIPSIINRPDNFPRFFMAVLLLKDNQDDAILYSENRIQQIRYSRQLDCFIKESGIFDNEYVQRDNPTPNQAIQAQVNRAKMQVYQIF